MDMKKNINPVYIKKIHYIIIIKYFFSYNVSNISEKIELMSLQVIERYVSCETASSYQPLPSSAKKRNERLK